MNIFLKFCCIKKVSYKESFQINGYLHIVMLYCDGGDLYTKIKEQNGRFLEETQIVEWFVQIAMAIQVKYNNYQILSIRLDKRF